MGLIVLCIADAGSRVSLTGGPYAYVGAALGPYAAFLSGVLLWMLGLFATAAVATVFAASVGQLVPALAPWQPYVLLVTFGVLVAGEHARRRPRRAAERGGDGGQAAAAAAHRRRRPVPGARRAPHRDGLAVGRRRRPHVAAARVRLRRRRVGARAERRGAGHRAHRAARHRAGDARHHRALHRAAGLGAGHPRPGARAARRRRWPTRRARPSAAGRGRCCSPARRSRCSATWAA